MAVNTPDPNAAAPPVVPAPQTPPADDGEPKWDTQTRAYIENLRQENAKRRTENNALAEKMKTIEPIAKKWEDLTKLVSGNGEPTDPTSVIKEKDGIIAARDLQLKEMRVEMRLGDRITRAGLHPDLTKALLKQQNILKDLDPESADFDKNTDGHLKKIGEDFPQLKIVGLNPKTPGRSGTDGSTGGPGAGASTQLTREQIKGWKPEDIEKAFKEGKLNQMLGRT
jgi:hypothetical protein